MWNFACPLVVYGDNALDYLAQVKGKKLLLSPIRTLSSWD
jgi:hypothetical protein